MNDKNNVSRDENKFVKNISDSTEQQVEDNKANGAEEEEEEEEEEQKTSGGNGGPSSVSENINEKSILYPVVFLIGMSIIILEIGLTRVFSIALWHHFAFLSISIALFGLGVSGVFLTVWPQILKNNFYKTLVNFAWLLSLSNLTAFFIFTRLNLDVRDLGNPVNLIKFVIFYLFLALPFFFGGCVMSAIISRKSEIVQKLYFFDLIGAGLGCIIVVFFIRYLGGQGIIILSSLFSSLAALVALKGLPPVESRKKSFAIILFIIGLTIILPAVRWVFPIPLPPDKALSHYMKEKGSKVIYSIWNSFSRIDAFYPVPEYTWGLSENFKGKMPEQIGITIDGDGFTSVVNYNGNWKDVTFPYWTLGSLVHILNKGGKTLIIGAGGGIDVLSSRSFGTKEIDAVEINPDIAKLPMDNYKDFAGNLFCEPGIKMFVAEGRNFIKRNNKKYDLVYLPLVDSWAATYSGAYSLSENYLYTTEAFKDYFDHVNPDGFLSISRWEYVPQQPYQSLRICSLAMAAVGVDMRKSVIVTGDGKLANIIIKKGELTPEEIRTVVEFCNRGKFNILYIPGVNNDFEQVLNQGNSISFQQGYPLDISAVSDDRPFFYLTDRWRNFFFYLNNSISRGLHFPVVFTIVLVVLFMSLIFTVIFILLPLKVKKVGNFSGKSSVLYMVYFSLLGLSFMFVEITLMTKLSLFLGHPTYALSVVLFSLLIFTGIGSLISSLMKFSAAKILKIDISLLTTIGIMYYFIMDRIFIGTLSSNAEMRVLISIILIAPLGICMGIPFPLGLRTLGKENSSLIPWAWGVNGCASVLGSVLALIFAQGFGFWNTLLCSLIFYIIAMLVFIKIPGCENMENV